MPMASTSAAHIPALLARLEQGYDMVVGARDRSGQANLHRGLANGLYNRLASWMTGHRDGRPDLWLPRGARRQVPRVPAPAAQRFQLPHHQHHGVLPQRLPVAYVSIPVAKRVGTNSHIRPLKDGVRFLLIIFKIASLYSPLKLFVPVAVAFFLMALGYYGYTFVTEHRLTNMSTLLFSASVIIFLIGLVSEQITNLTYRQDK
jgi:hypothetical protein